MLNPLGNLPKNLPNPQQLVAELTEKLTSRLADNPAINPAKQQPLLLQALVQETLAKLNLVSYSDYTRLLEIHQLSRTKLDELEAKITQLEEQIAQQTPNQSVEITKETPAATQQEGS